MYSKKTKKISLVLFSLGALLLYSCRENPSTEEKTTTQTETTTPVEKKADPVESNGDVALNPAHGQLGHRCDIPVGAPLNSDPAPIKTNTQSSSGLPDNGTVLPAGSLNPAHGQPGHRCDIKVGDPL